MYENTKNFLYTKLKTRNMDISAKQIKVTFNNGDIKYATISEVKRGYLKSLSYAVKYELEDIEKEFQKELLKYKKFHDHIKAHFEKEHPEWEVKCKICDKTFNQIVEEI